MIGSSLLLSASPNFTSDQRRRRRLSLLRATALDRLLLLTVRSFLHEFPEKLIRLPPSAAATVDFPHFVISRPPATKILKMPHKSTNGQEGKRDFSPLSPPYERQRCGNGMHIYFRVSPPLSLPFLTVTVALECISVCLYTHWRANVEKSLRPATVTVENGCLSTKKRKKESRKKKET